MKNPNFRSLLLVSLMFIASFAAAWLSVSMVRAGRAAQDGLVSYDLPQMPPDDELRVGPYSNFNNPHLAGPDDPVEVMVELEDPPAIEAFVEAQGDATFAGEAAPQAVAAAQARIARIEQAQATLTRVLAGPQFKAKIIFSVQRVYNGLTVRVASGKLAEIHALPGVKAVHFPELIYPATDTSVPFIGAHRAWDPSLQGGYRGEGITIAVIDSGVDYTHANLGGSGSVATYNSNNPTIVGDIADFPNAKVIGGVDLVGDSYNAADPNNNTPNPDPDPVDCRGNGHGTGTASIAAGIGVNANGTPYTGAYNQSINFSSFRIGPGVAPKANLYAIRVFGCNALGATSNAVVTQAIDRALDPNQDGNFSDRARVVLLPGGGPFTTLPNSPVIAAINNGAQMNVLYVGALGNGGDTYLAAGGPALAEGALGVVANADNGLFAQNIRVNSPANIAGTYPGAVTEFGFPLNVAYTRQTIRATPNDGCAPLTNGSQVNGNIAFIDRGTCTLTTKARNAQAAGAVAVIFANNTAALPVSVGDDGTGSDIIIPSFLMAQNGGDAIRQELNGGQAVNVSLTPGDVTSQAGLANSYASFNPYGGVYASTSRGPRNDILKPDIAAPGTNIGSAKVGSGNNYFFFTGTSSAAPHVAGTAALVAQKFPDATSQSIYDLVRSADTTGIFSGANSAPPQRGPSLVGGGGVNAQAAVTTNASVKTTRVLTAINLYGEVIEATNTQTIQPNITLDWKGSSAVSYTTTNNFLATIPGVTCTNTNPTGTVPPNSLFNLNYVCGINPAALKRQCAPWVSPTQTGIARHCLPEYQGSTIFNFAGSNLPVKTQIYLGLRPASQMGTQQTSINLTGTTGAFTLNLTGQGVNNGPTLPGDWRSFVSPSELQWIDPNDALTPPELDYFDLQYVGVRKADNRLIFVLSAYEDWRSPNEVRHNVFIDTNRDGRDDYHLFTTSLPNAQGAPSDVQITRLFNINTQTFVPQTFFTNSFSPATLDSALYYSNVISLPVDVSLLNLNGPFNYTVKTSFGSVVVDESARLTYDAANPGLDFGATTMFNNLPGGTIPASYTLNNFRSKNSEGMLLLHHLNTRGNRAQILPANLGVEGDVAPRPGGNGSVTVADWTQIGRFVVGLDEANLGNEFQRADVAPRTTAGNGQLTVADWVQAGRYAAGLDPIPNSGGPVIPPTSPQFAPPDTTGKASASRERQPIDFSIINSIRDPLFAIRNRPISFAVEVEARGVENALSFSLNFNPAALGNPRIRLSEGLTGASLQINANQAARGRLGIALALPPGQTLPPGRRQLAIVTFTSLEPGGANVSAIEFGDLPLRREAADQYAGILPAARLSLAQAIERRSPTR